MDESILEEEIRIAKENIDYLQDRQLWFDGHKILEIGFGYGFNSKLLRDFKATVYGLEPSKEYYETAIGLGNIDIDKAFNCTLEDIPPELIGTFDIVLAFFYNVPFEKRESMAQLLANLVKDTGTVVVGLDNEFLIKGGCGINPLGYSFISFFETSDFKYMPYNIGNKQFIILTGPRKKLVEPVDKDKGIS